MKMDDLDRIEQQQRTFGGTPISRNSPPDSMGAPYCPPSQAHESQLLDVSEVVPPDATASNAPYRHLEIDVSRPMTPKSRPLTLPWYGLATPGSPDASFSEADRDIEVESSVQELENDTCDTVVEMSETPISDTCTSNDDRSLTSASPEEDGNDVQETDEALASANGPRRSARVRHKDVNGDNVHIHYGERKYSQPIEVTTKPTAPKSSSHSKDEHNSADLANTHDASLLLAEINLTVPPESSLASEAVAKISFDYDTDVLSADWQLKWPPGGSTHPSYPYPSPDPRLLFDTRVVPVKDGLPCIGEAPELMLPVGWKHVTWSGLLPIAFDPYNQAFKLTAVGPLPLTHEEVQQNALSNFVPGGAHHPEAGLLPDVSHLGDGSADDDLDLEGASWTLPFLNLGTLDLSWSSGASQVDRNDTSLQEDDNDNNNSTREAYDCPDKVYDLQDAWRWIIEKETRPLEKFKPSATKQWKGSRAERATRKLKMPIPEMMAFAIQDSYALDDYFATNQDSRPGRKISMFCPFVSVSTPWSVDIALLADTEFTIAELLTYFPQHIKWYGAATRLARAELSGQYVQKFINMTRRLSGEASMKRTVMTGQLAVARNRLPPTASTVSDDGSVQSESATSTTSYTAEGWLYDGKWDLTDYPLLAITHGVQQLPTGDDAGPLTALIHWCRANQRHKALLSEVPALLKEANIVTLIEPGSSGCPDNEVLGRVIDKLKIDHRRVLRSLDELELARKQGGGEEQAIRKKRKLT